MRDDGWSCERWLRNYGKFGARHLPLECRFANYLAELFERYLACRCHSMSDRSQGLRAPLRPFDQLFLLPAPAVDLENSKHLRRD